MMKVLLPVPLLPGMFDHIFAPCYVDTANLWRDSDEESDDDSLLNKDLAGFQQD